MRCVVCKDVPPLRIDPSKRPIMQIALQSDSSSPSGLPVEPLRFVAAATLQVGLQCKQLGER